MQLRNFATSQLRNYETKKLFPTLLSLSLLLILSSCQKDINAPTDEDFAKSQFVEQSQTKTYQDTNRMYFVKKDDDLPTDIPLPPCSPFSSTDDELPVRSPAYTGCCCINIISYVQSESMGIRGITFKIAFTQYAWNKKLFPNTLYRRKVIVRHNGTVILNEQYDYTDMNSPTCEYQPSWTGFRLRDGECPGRIHATFRMEYWLASNNAWVYCSQADKEFDCF